MSAGSAAAVRPVRHWSARALPVCLLALVLLVVSGVALASMVANGDTRGGSRLLSQEAMRQWIERQPWDGLVVLTVCGVIAVCGAMAIAAALLPGQRDLLPMWSPDRLTVGYLSARSAAAALVMSALNADRVLSARVRLGRRRARVSFRTAATTREEHDAAVAAVTEVLQRRFTSFGLVRPSRLRVTPRKFRPIAQAAPMPAAQPEASDIESERVSRP